MKAPLPKKLRELVRTIFRVEAHLLDLRDTLSSGLAAVASNNTVTMEALGRLIESAKIEGAKADKSLAIIEADHTVTMEALGGLIESAKIEGAKADKSLAISGADHQILERLEALIAARPGLTFEPSGPPQLPRRVNFTSTEQPLSLNPELRLIAFLRPYLTTDVVIDVGAHKGHFSEFLLRCGYTVFGFEPNPNSFTELVARLGKHPRFKAFNVALGNDDRDDTLRILVDHSDTGTYGDPTLYCSLVEHSLPADLKVTHTIPVTVRRLSSIVLEGGLPPRAAVLKIDTEGYELLVLKGATMLDVSIVMAEFWSKDSEFGAWGAQNDPLEMYLALRERGFSHLISFNRVHGTTEPTFHVNCPEAIKNSWGNALFFKDPDLFRRALDWCHLSLRRIYFGTPSDTIETNPAIHA
jgi:FkbM family methyltransferase